jgi:hypothetical protein
MDVSTCRHIIEDLLSSYVDGELDAKTAQTLELHMQMCPPCAAFLRTFLATKRCLRTATVTAMSSDCAASLWSFLERELGADTGGCSGHAKSAGEAKPPSGRKQE